MATGWLLLAAAVGLAVALTFARHLPRLSAIATLAASVLAASAALASLTTGTVWDWQPGFELGGQAVHLRLDALGALFLALIAVVGGVGSIYAQEYWPDAVHGRSASSGRRWWAVLLFSMGSVVLAANGLHFLIAWELFTLSAYFLITLRRDVAEVRQAGWLFLAASHTSAVCLFAFFAALAAATGSWALGPLHGRPDLAPLFWLALVGFGIKAGMFPLHVWLPSAHAHAPSHVSAVLSGVAIKMGIYGLVRFSGWMDVPEQAGWAVAILGMISAVLGVAFALAQHDLKRLLAYHSVENIGIILLGLGLAMIAVAHGGPAWGVLALAGGLLHVWNHGLFKSLLFLGAGSVLHATGTREMSRLGGLWRAMPWTTGCFALGAAAISGLPPLNGFVSEFLVYLALFDATVARQDAVVIAVAGAVALALTGALALACFCKACGVVFLGAARTAAAERAHECGPRMRGSMVALAAACVTIGLAPLLFWPLLENAVAAWHPAWAGRMSPSPLRGLGLAHPLLAGLAFIAAAWLWRRSRLNAGGWSRASTWDCGYAAPTARMQYTAGSFASIVTDWFAWILRPERHVQEPQGLFPWSARHEAHTPETVLDRLVRPAASGVIRAAHLARRLQHGRLPFYFVYLAAGMLAVAWIVSHGSVK